MSNSAILKMFLQSLSALFYDTIKKAHRFVAVSYTKFSGKQTNSNNKVSHDKQSKKRVITVFY